MYLIILLYVENVRVGKLHHVITSRGASFISRENWLTMNELDVIIKR